PIFGSENGHDYRQWRAVTDNDYIAGQCLWTGIDYLGETSGWPEHGSRAGHMTTAGFEKADYYLRKSFWNEKDRFVKIATCKKDAPGWMEFRRFIWNYDEGEEVKVEAYTAAEDVELFVNGRSKGRAARDEWGKFTWTVPFEKGEIKAVAGFADGTVCEDVLSSENEAVRLTARLIDEGIAANGVSCAQIEVLALDRKGRIAENAKIPVTIETEGDISFIHMDNGNLRDTTDYVSNTRETHHGRLMVYVKSGTVPGKAKVKLKSCLGETEVCISC
ncbi:MAG: DUF4982 domain-containing protein, partial [Lachnospiraceae bacterium]|nr:DUF4982 domain-containing protein [Lachnospiraceae bacterium]